eukprot:CAMPEP_0172830556 /NCGR_PEP_ID=MMETSP1075-20121228/22346_1 /TAXON_ID=2916 /ORGANISM="Ceratium fusus, Strain PA161109" /LENGTH=484 /DNA_ID=CAMNT_0013672875 /DNA_START=1 /DNA_END=1455 /DNA_ORIENTATION=+
MQNTMQAAAAEAVTLRSRAECAEDEALAARAATEEAERRAIQAEDTLASERAAAGSQAAALQEGQGQAAERAEHLERQLVAARHAAEKAEHRTNQVEQALETMKSNAEKKLAQVQSELQNTKASHEDVKQRAVQVESELNRSRASIEEMTQHRVQVEGELQSTKALHEEMKQRLVQAEASHNTERGRAENAQQELQILSMGHEDATRRMQELQTNEERLQVFLSAERERFSQEKNHDVAAAEERAAQMQLEHDRLRTEVNHLEQRLAAYEQEAESIGLAKESSIEEGVSRSIELPVVLNEGPEPVLIGRAASPETSAAGIMNGWAPEEVESISSAAEGEPLLASLGLTSSGRKKGDQVSIKDLCVRVAELHRENSDLQRELESRPANLFGSGDDLVGVDEESGLRACLEPMGPAPDASDWKGYAKHHAQITLHKVHQHQHVQRVEQQLRIVTRKLLQRPVWLWLFYMQLVFVWLAEFGHLLFAR